MPYNRNKTQFITLIVFTLLLVGCASKPSPENTVKSALDNLLKGNYEKAFVDLIDTNGEPVSEGTKQGLRASLESTPISAYKIKDISDANLNLHEYSFLKRATIFSEFKVASFTLTEKATKNTRENKLILVKHIDSWKILMLQYTGKFTTDTSPWTSYLGLLKAEKVFTFDEKYKQFMEGSLASDTYFEFTSDGRWCSKWVTGQPKCLKYDTFTISDDSAYIITHEEDLAARQVRYEWHKIIGGQLQLTAQELVNGDWQPSIMYHVKPIARPIS